MCPVSNSYILVVDDSDDNLFLLQTLLQAEGYTVDVANSGHLALEKIENLSPALILMDVMMPDMSGYEVTQKIRQNPKTAHIPIVLVTAYSEMDALEGLALGANDFVRKPIEFDQLLSRIDTLLQSP